MWHYDKPLILQYPFTQISFAGSNVVRRIPVPVIAIGENGRRPGGKVLSVQVLNITTGFAGATTDGSVQVGTDANPDAYFETRPLDEGDDTGEVFWLNNVDPDAVDIERNRDDITVTFVASTGTPAGVADFILTILWF